MKFILFHLPLFNRSGAADDGTLEDFEHRLRKWKNEKGGTEDEETHKLDGDLEVPMSIWSRLYK